MKPTKTPVPREVGKLKKRRQHQPTHGRAYRCQCDRPVFFRNSECLGCTVPLGYEAGRARVVPLLVGSQPSTWTFHGDDSGTLYQRCANFETAAACNWLVAQGTGGGLCRACELNRTIPNQSEPENCLLWGRIELAKRRLVSQLLGLGLPVHSKVTTDPEHGLAFDFLHSPEGGPPVMTGHANGIVTLNIEEADDASREKIRLAMHEPYRTLLGHLRHEVGHYYWDRLVRDGTSLDAYRTLFGDERDNYADALKRNYEQGAPADWAQRFVSTYASSHPWEDWAETWAHYMHMEDTMDTALSFGLDADDVEIDYDPFGRDALWNPEAEGAQDFLDFINAWIELTSVLNELSRSMGEPDFYPFVLNRPVVAKLQFIHEVVRTARAAEAAVQAASTSTASNAQRGLTSNA